MSDSRIDFEYANRAEPGNLSPVYSGYFERHFHVRLGAEIVDFVGLYSPHDMVDTRGIIQIAIAEPQAQIARRADLGKCGRFDRC